MVTTYPSSILERSGYSECLDRLSAGDRAGRPRATYRLQFNHQFRFRDAAAQVEYLQQLGISHCYASPILQARAGSMHGYDITNHDLLNEEIGSTGEFEQLARELKSRGMGLLLDLVPNHVGVGDHNPWWQDVLESGRASEFADYFDIDWQPLKAELREKLLLPILGAQYGEELEQGHIKLAFQEDEARFVIEYFDQHLPVDPQAVPLIFSPVRAHERFAAAGEWPAESRFASEGHDAGLAELHALLSEFGALPPHTTADPDLAQERRRRIPELRNKFRGLLQISPAALKAAREAVATLNGEPGKARSFDGLHRLLEAQVYRLAHWRVSAEEINYRRFFDINDLVGLRMENPRVFAATHRLIRRLLADGNVSGLRIDHPDGLLNPRQYFTRLQMLYAASQCAGGEPHPPLAENGIEADFQEVFSQHDWLRQKPPLYVVVEKILQPGEQLPAEWTVDGTVGYDFANQVNGIFIDRAAVRPLTTLYHRFLGKAPNPQREIYESKKLVMNTSLPSEVNVLTHMLEEICQSDRRARDFTRKALRDAITEIIACFPVYRTYIDERGNVGERDRAIVGEATARAKRSNEGTPAAIFDFVRSVLLLEGPATGSADARRQRLYFALKFQQLTGPVMAKGLEDTACYAYNRFIAVNEVGGSPQNFGVSVPDFHRANQERAQHWPFAMLATSTHDTKRSEDVRARLDVLSEMPKLWAAQVGKWRRANHSRKRVLSDGRSVPDSNEEYLLYQTLVGAAPLVFETTSEPAQSETRQQFIARIQQYMNKAVHEAKINLSWVNSNPEYVAALEHFVERILTPGSERRPNNFWEEFRRFLPPVSFFGAINSLAQLLLKLTSPGVPDIYQGNEIWDFSLVDPDNRRPVDFAARQQMLASLETRANGSDFASLARELVSGWQDGRIKMWTTLRALRFRREHSELFQSGTYLPLEASGSRREHVCAFARVREASDEMAVVVVPRLSYKLMQGAQSPPLGEAWGDTQLALPRSSSSHFLNVLTGQVVRLGANRNLLCSELFADFPVVLLTAG
jgi:(1->4)-alpha-D-glucan 1-alpha-D-glucosylmutase